MPSSASGYGTFQPGAVDPFPIESVLAKIVGENNVDNAANLLGQYHQERMTSTGNYDYEMDRQHQFAKENLAAQMADNIRKQILEGGRQAGGLDLLAGAGVSIDPVLRTRLEQNARDMQRAEQFQKGASGLASSTAAGFQPNTQQAAIATANLAGPQGMPEAEKVALINASSQRASAGPGISLSVPLPAQDALGGVAPNMTIPKGMTVAQGIEWARQNGLNINTPVKQPPPGAMTDKKGQTNLPNNTSAQPAPRVANAAKGGGDLQAKAEAFVENDLRTKNRAAYDDIQAGKVGGKVVVMQDPKTGQITIKGKQGTYQ